LFVPHHRRGIQFSQPHIAKRGPLGQILLRPSRKGKPAHRFWSLKTLTVHLSDKSFKKAKSGRRLETEDAIIDAFERLIVRDGVAGLGVNALIKEAGGGKKQLYDYFGSISGVAEAWVQERGIWPPLEEIVGESMESFGQRRPVEKLRLINRKCAEMLRDNAPLCELLTGEFVRSKEVKEAVDHIRQLVRLDFERVLKSDPALSGEDYLALNTVAYAATTYLALRAHCQPRFFGFDLSTETSWQMVMNMFDRVMDNAERGITSRNGGVD
jgi:AcrR family transcriptional regulator